MAERLRRYEENDEEMVLKEEQMRRSIKEERTKLRMREKTLQGVSSALPSIQMPLDPRRRGGFANRCPADEAVC